MTPTTMTANDDDDNVKNTQMKCSKKNDVADNDIVLLV